MLLAETECSHPATREDRRASEARSAACSGEVTTRSGRASVRRPFSVASTLSCGTARHETPFHR